MAKQGGLGGRFFYAGNDLSGDIQQWKTSGGPAPLDVTDITQSAHSRLGGLRDGSISVTSYWDPLVAHPVFSALPATDQIATVCIGATPGSPAASMVGLQLNYDGTRATDGMYTFAIDEAADGFGLEWGQLLTAGMVSQGAAGSLTSIDTVASASFGAQAYLHVSAFTGTSITVAVQDSADNTTFANVTGLGFTAVTAAPAAQRIAIANTATVREFVRVTTTGTFSAATFAVVLVKNSVAGVVF